jgi:hypothetical protein
MLLLRAPKPIASTAVVPEHGRTYRCAVAVNQPGANHDSVTPTAAMSLRLTPLVASAALQALQTARHAASGSISDQACCGRDTSVRLDAMAISRPVESKTAAFVTDVPMSTAITGPAEGAIRR